ncbi:L-aspartate oxidase [Enemella sp. A6]|uniref:L-aspartate oxidase n=1 Tax=Enemella sp. A6 TaxID=3440152 RepID=UPI003EBA03F6
MNDRLLSTAAPAWQQHTSVVIVGSGAAGLAAAIHLASARVPTVLITRAGIRDSATDRAQGGLAAMWAADDSAALHIADTLTAGAGLCEPDTVRDLVAAAPEALRRLIELGAEFDRDASDNDQHDYDLHLEGGHQRRRILHAGDSSGAEVMRTLIGALARARSVPDATVTVREDVRALDVLTDSDGATRGVRVLADDGSIGDLVAPAVVLATGGAGQLWRGTSNPAVATGDGLAMAWRAGAVLRDLEFVQFHPTVLAVPGERGVLISEAVRGEGAVLIDRTGAPVMAGLHPLADLAPRDVVAAAMHAHLQRTGAPHLFLDGTALGAEEWRERFPAILEMCRARGINPATEPIPVQPGAHYLCGGVAADLSGRTSVPGLYAVGEVAATGLHGANRLASNSLPEALVAGDRVGELLAAEPALSALPPEPRPDSSAEAGATTLIDPSAIERIRDVMTSAASVARDADGLGDAARTLTTMCDADTNLTQDSITATNLHTVATLVVAAARARTESRGAHRRTDHPHTDPSWARHLTWQRTADGVIAGTSPVNTKPVNANRNETEAA